MDGYFTIVNHDIVYITNTRWMGISEENETLQDTLETFATQNYVYAREWLADVVKHNIITDCNKALIIAILLLGPV